MLKHGNLNKIIVKYKDHSSITFINRKMRDSGMSFSFEYAAEDEVSKTTSIGDIGSIAPCPAVTPKSISMRCITPIDEHKKKSRTEILVEKKRRRPRLCYSESETRQACLAGLITHAINLHCAECVCDQLSFRWRLPPPDVNMA